MKHGRASVAKSDLSVSWLLRSLAHDVRYPLHTIRLGLEELPADELSQRMHSAMRDILDMLSAYGIVEKGDLVEQDEGRKYVVDLAQVVREGVRETGFQLNIATSGDRVMAVVVDAHPLEAATLQPAVGWLLQMVGRANGKKSQIQTTNSWQRAPSQPTILIVSKGSGLPPFALRADVGSWRTMQWMSSDRVKWAAAAILLKRAGCVIRTELDEHGLSEVALSFPAP